jgi:two-component system chemotaxis sensor kinase CheA
MNDKELLEKLKVIFLQEAKERFNSILTKLIEIEQHDDPSLCTDIVEVIFRDLHSLKGASRSINLNKIEGLFQELETLFGDIKNEKIKITKKLLNTIQTIISEMDSIINENGVDSLNSESVAKRLEGKLSELSILEQAPSETKQEPVSATNPTPPGKSASSH